MDLNDFISQNDPDDTSLQATQQMLMEDARARMINAGIEAEQFLTSSLGKSLLEAAAMELRRARIELEGLYDKSLDDTALAAEFKRHMSRILMIKTAMNWLFLAMKKGRSPTDRNFFNEEDFL